MDRKSSQIEQKDFPVVKYTQLENLKNKIEMLFVDYKIYKYNKKRGKEVNSTFAIQKKKSNGEVVTKMHSKITKNKIVILIF